MNSRNFVAAVIAAFKDYAERRLTIGSALVGLLFVSLLLFSLWRVCGALCHF